MTTDIDQQIAEYLAKGGKIQKADASDNAEAKTRFKMTPKGPRYVNKKLARSRQNIHNKPEG